MDNAQDKLFTLAVHAGSGVRHLFLSYLLPNHEDYVSLVKLSKRHRRRWVRTLEERLVPSPYPTIELFRFAHSRSLPRNPFGSLLWEMVAILVANGRRDYVETCIVPNLTPEDWEGAVGYVCQLESRTKYMGVVARWIPSDRLREVWSYVSHYSDYAVLVDMMERGLLADENKNAAAVCRFAQQRLYELKYEILAYHPLFRLEQLPYICLASRKLWDWHDGRIVTPGHFLSSVIYAECKCDVWSVVQLMDAWGLFAEGSTALYINTQNVGEALEVLTIFDEFGIQPKWVADVRTYCRTVKLNSQSGRT
jgi:hypothetical protein